MASVMPTTEQALSFAVDAIRRSDIERGRAALTWVLQREPDNVVAWLWLSDCVQDTRVREECLRRLSALDPFK